jgi:hypothetical protein
VLVHWSQDGAPDRKPGNKGLSERDELGSLCCGIGHQGFELVERFVSVEKHGCRLDGSYPHYGQSVIRHLGNVLAECVGKMRRSLTVMIWLFMDDRDGVHSRSTESMSTVFDNSREDERCGRNSWRPGSIPRTRTSTLRFCGGDARRLRRRHVRQT